MSLKSAVTATPLRRQFDRDGYVVVRRALDPALVEEMHRHTDWLMNKYPEKSPKDLHLADAEDPFYHRVVSDDRLLDIAGQFLGPDLAIFAAGYILKPPRTGMPVLWHQDGSYWPLEPMEVCTLWVAITESTPENGCMRVIPGTHELELKGVTRTEGDDNFLQSEMDRALVDESKAVDLVLAPGDVSIHHPNIIHGSNANHSDRWRRNMVCRYISATTRIMQENWPYARHLRGKLTPGINDYRPRPKFIDGEHMEFTGCDAWR